MGSGDKTNPDFPLDPSNPRILDPFIKITVSQ